MFIDKLSLILAAVRPLVHVVAFFVALGSSVAEEPPTFPCPSDTYVAFDDVIGLIERFPDHPVFQAAIEQAYEPRCGSFSRRARFLLPPTRDAAWQEAAETLRTHLRKVSSMTDEQIEGEVARQTLQARRQLPTQVYRLGIILTTPRPESIGLDVLVLRHPGDDRTIVVPDDGRFPELIDRELDDPSWGSGDVAAHLTGMVTPDACAGTFVAYDDTRLFMTSRGSVRW